MNHFFTWGSLALWFVFCLIYNIASPTVTAKLSTPPQTNMYYIAYMLFDEAQFWFTAIMASVICLFPAYLHSL